MDCSGDDCLERAELYQSLRRENLDRDREESLSRRTRHTTDIHPGSIIIELTTSLAKT